MIIRHRGVTGLLASGSRQPAAFRLFSNARSMEDNDDDFRFTGEHKDRLTVEWKRINQHAEAGEIKPAQDLFHQIKPLLPPRLYTCGYNMLLKACAKHALIHPTTNNGVQHLNKPSNEEDPALTYTIKTSAEVEVAKQIYQEMIGNGIRLNARTFGKLMEVAGNSGDVHTASLWYQAMKKKGFSPNVVVFNILIDACGRRGDVGMAKWWWGEMGPAGVAPTVCSFNALLSAYTRAGDFASAEGCFDEMHRRGFDPDLISFTTMIDIYGKSNEKDAPNKVEHWFRQMLAADLKPDIITYNVLLSAFARQRDVNTVLHYYQRLPENGLIANVNTCNAILLAVSNDRKAMREWFDFMLKEDVRPDVVSLNTVVCERDLFFAFARLGLCFCERILNGHVFCPTCSVCGRSIQQTPLRWSRQGLHWVQAPLITIIGLTASAQQLSRQGAPRSAALDFDFPNATRFVFRCFFLSQSSPEMNCAPLLYLWIGLIQLVHLQLLAAHWLTASNTCLSTRGGPRV